MDRRPEDVPDWRDASAYAPLLEVGRELLAWEWLRRDARYRDAAFSSSDDFGAPLLQDPANGSQWGLHGFEDPREAAPRARPVWRRDHYAFVLRAVAKPAGKGAEGFELDRLKGLFRLVRSRAGAEHLLLSDGCRSIRIDIVEGSVAAGPVRLSYLIEGLSEAEGPLLVLRRLLGLWRSGRFPANLFPAEPRRPKWVLMLRAADALYEGASQREIAQVLLSAEAGAARWRLAAPSLRSRVQRLVRCSRIMSAGGYHSLLES